MPERLAERIGAQPLLLRQEIAKLSLLAGPEREVTLEHVVAAAVDVAEEPVWDLTDAIGDGRGADALALLARLARGGAAPPLVLGALAAHFRRLLRLRGGGSLGVPPFVRQKLEAQAQRYTRVASGRLPRRDPRDGSRAQGLEPAGAAAQPRAPRDRPLGSILGIALATRAAAAGVRLRWRAARRRARRPEVAQARLALLARREIWRLARFFGITPRLAARRSRLSASFSADWRGLATAGNRGARLLDRRAHAAAQISIAGAASKRLTGALDGRLVAGHVTSGESNGGGAYPPGRRVSTVGRRFRPARRSPITTGGPVDFRRGRV